MFVCASQNIVSHAQEGAITHFVFEIRLSETIEYVEFPDKASAIGTLLGRCSWYVCSSNLLPGRDPSCQCSEESGL